MLRRAKLDMLEEKQAEVEHYRGRLERVQREYEERLHGTATELQRLQLEKTLLQVRPNFPTESLQASRWRQDDLGPALTGGLGGRFIRPCGWGQAEQDALWRLDAAVS